MSVTAGWPSEIVSNESPRYFPPIRDQKPLSAEELVELACSPKAGLFGKLEAIERTRLQQKMQESFEVAKQRNLVQELRRQVEAAGPTNEVKRERFQNPTENGRPRTVPGKGTAVDAEGLRPADLAWLTLVAQRNPADLDEASVRHLAMLEASAKAHEGTAFGSSDYFLAQEVMRPVRRHYELAAAQHELDQLVSADDDYFQMDGVSMEQAVGEAIQKETPALSKMEAFNRALEAIESARAERRTDYDDRVAELRARITELRK